MRTLVLFVSLLLASPAVASTYYVSVAGTGAAPCSIGDPCSLVTAKAAVRAEIAAGLSAPVVVRLRAGRYAISAPLSFTALDSGTAAYQVAWTGYPTEDVQISGGTIVTGWSLYSGGIYRASVGTGLSFRSVWVNGAHANRAAGAVFELGWTTNDTGYTSPTDMSSWGNPSLIEITGVGGWFPFRGLVDSISGTAVTMRTPYWTIYRYFESPWGIRFGWVENALELLDAAGEWYYDPVGGYLYYQPASGDMSTDEVVIPSSVGLIRMDGASNITFSNLSISHSNFVWPDLDLGYLQEGNTYITSIYYANPGVEVLPPAAVEVDDSTDITFARVRFEHLGDPIALSLLGTTARTTVRGSYFGDNAGGGIVVGDMQDCETNQVQDTSVIGNYFEQDGAYDYQGAIVGVSATCADRVTVANNTVVHSAIGWNTFSLIGAAPGPQYGFHPGHASNVIFEDNRITYTSTYYYLAGTTRYLDQGAIYGFQLLGSGETDRCQIAGNYIYASNGAYCVYLDAYTQWAKVTGNVCQNSFATGWLAASYSSDNIEVSENYTDVTTYINGGGGGVSVSANQTIDTELVVEGTSTREGSILCKSGIRWGAGTDAQSHERTIPSACSSVVPSEAWR